MYVSIEEFTIINVKYFKILEEIYHEIVMLTQISLVILVSFGFNFCCTLIFNLFNYIFLIL